MKAKPESKWSSEDVKDDSFRWVAFRFASCKLNQRTSEKVCLLRSSWSRKRFARSMFRRILSYPASERSRTVFFKSFNLTCSSRAIGWQTNCRMILCGLSNISCFHKLCDEAFEGQFIRLFTPLQSFRKSAAAGQVCRHGLSMMKFVSYKDWSFEPEGTTVEYRCLPLNSRKLYQVKMLGVS